MKVAGTVTSGSLVDLVLDEEIDHGEDRGKESKLGDKKLMVSCKSS